MHCSQGGSGELDSYTMTEWLERVPVATRILNYFLAAVCYADLARIPSISCFLQTKNRLVSELLDPLAASFVDASLPLDHQGKWALLYSSSQHGESFSTFR